MIFVASLRHIVASGDGCCNTRNRVSTAQHRYYTERTIDSSGSDLHEIQIMLMVTESVSVLFECLPLFIVLLIFNCAFSSSWRKMSESSVKARSSVKNSIRQILSDLPSLGLCGSSLSVSVAQSLISEASVEQKISPRIKLWREKAKFYFSQCSCPVA